METLALPGRILYLAANEEAIRSQLAGGRLARRQAGSPRRRSTDLRPGDAVLPQRAREVREIVEKAGIEAQ